MQTHEYRRALFRLAMQQLHHRHLMMQIQMIGGLIRQPDGRLLGQCRGNGHPLALPAGEGVDQPITEQPQRQGLHGLIGQTQIPGGFPLPGRQKRVTANQHRFPNRGRETVLTFLKDHRHFLRQLPTAQLGQTVTVQQHLTTAWRP